MYLVLNNTGTRIQNYISVAATLPCSDQNFKYVKCICKIYSSKLVKLSVCSGKGLTLETPALHQTSPAKNRPYQPLLIKPLWFIILHWYDSGSAYTLSLYFNAERPHIFTKTSIDARDWLGSPKECWLIFQSTVLSKAVHVLLRSSIVNKW